MEINQNNRTAFQGNTNNYQDPGRGTLILVLGILSLTILGLFAGIPAWVMGNKDLKKIRMGLIAFSAKTTTQVGMILGIISTALSAIAFVGIIAAIMIPLFLGSSIGDGDKAIEELKDNPQRAILISECSMVARLAQQYYTIPVEMGGGSNTFFGVDKYISENMISRSSKMSPKGTISFENIDQESFVVVNTGKVTGNDGINPIKVSIKVYSYRIEPAEIIN